MLCGGGGLKPLGGMESILADGTVLRRKVSRGLIEPALGTGGTPVVLGENEDENLLWASRLSGYPGLVLDLCFGVAHPIRALVYIRAASLLGI